MGWKGWLRRARAPQWPRLEQSQYRSYRAVHPFDERYGVDTSGLVYDLPTGHAHDACNNGYFAVAPSVFHDVLARLRLPYERFTFVDLGSGKGRALLLAAGLPFREVIGVELNVGLHRLARANTRRYTGDRRSPIRCVLGDAAGFALPAGSLVLYMWNSFTGPVMERVLANLHHALATEPREVYLLYVHPELESMMDATPWLRRRWWGEVPMSEEDCAAWAFPTHGETCAIYYASSDWLGRAYPA